MSKYLIISRLQRDNGPSSLQFGRLWSNRFGENRLTDACRAVFSKQAAPKSHAFLFCHEPLPPDTRCGELRGGLSSRVQSVFMKQRQADSSRLKICNNKRRQQITLQRKSRCNEQQQTTNLLPARPRLLRKFSYIWPDGHIYGCASAEQINLFCIRLLRIFGPKYNINLNCYGTTDQRDTDSVR